MISFATVAAAKSYKGLVHVWLPEDPDEAHNLFVDLSKGQQRHGATKGDETNFHDVVEHGGFSHHPTRGPAPDTGWMVSYDSHKEPGLGAEHDLKDLTADHIAAHRQGAAHHLKKAKTYQGGWLDREHAKVYLDVSRHFDDKDEEGARQFGLDHRQKAYFHLNDFSEHFYHPQHDPLMIEDHNAWASKYQGERMKVPDQYRSYQHLYPPSADLQKHLDERHEKLAATERARMVARRRIV